LAWTLAAVTAAEGIGLVVVTVIEFIRSFFLSTGFTMAPAPWLATAARWIGDTVSLGVVALDGLLRDARVDGFELRWYIWAALGIAVVWILFAAREALGVVFIGAVLLTLGTLVLVMPSGWLHGVLGSWWAVAGVWVLGLCVPTAAALFAYQQNTRDNNPLKGGLSSTGQPASTR
jgi:hypothetical protein